MEPLKANNIVELIQKEIVLWHETNADRPKDAVILTDEIRRIRPLGEHRSEPLPVIRELVRTNSEMWHEEDKVRSADDETVLRAIRNINPLNQHRNDLIEEIDEIFLDEVKAKEAK